MKTLVYSFMLVILPFAGKAQGEWVSASIDRGTVSNSTALYIRSTSSFDANKCDNLVFTVRIPLAAGPGVSITEVSRDPAFNHLTFTIQKINVTDGAYHYYLVNGSGSVQAPAGQTIDANTPFKVLELQYTGGISGAVELVNLENDLPGNIYLRPQFYIQINLGDITRYSEIFYGTGGAVPVNNEPGTGNDWVSTSSLIVLPVDFLSVSAFASGMDGLIKWNVTREYAETDEYQVERSTDGRLFSTISVIKARKSGSATEHYQHTDAGAGRVFKNKMLYYRIRQKDLHGRETISATKSIRFNQSESVFVYPNPVVSTGRLHLMLDSHSTIRIRIFNAAGKLVSIQSRALSSGVHDLELDTAHLPDGEYIITADDGISSWTLPIIKAGK